MKAIDRAFKEIDGDDSTSQNISEAHDKGQNEGESDEWSGIAESIAVAVQPVDREDDYIDEENYTTVTVEEVGISKEGFAKAADDSEASKIEADADGRRRLDGNASVVQNGRKKPPQHRNEKERKPKKKQKKFRYENKADRKVARAREGSRNSKMAKARKTK